MRPEVIPGDWITPPPLPPLCDDEVHVWVITAPAAGDEVLGALGRILDAEEAVRASRFKFERDRRLFMAAHGALRLMLAAALGLPPQELTFTHTPQGKPRLAGSLNRTDLRFNLTHSDQTIGIATSLSREVGIDIEKVRTDLNLVRLARRFLPSHQAAELEQAAAQDRPEAFFRLWTRREALLKASGNGLGGDLREGRGITAGNSGSTPQPALQDDKKTRWHCLSFDPGDGMAGAVAAEDGYWQPVFLRLKSLESFFP